VIGVKGELAVNGPGGIPDVDAGDAAGNQHPVKFIPHLVQLPVHELECVKARLAV
jgi:hypothetical protein